MADLIKRAQLGDGSAQKVCTEHGILLPCPLCGCNEGKAEWQNTQGNRGWSVSCDDCCVEIGSYETRDEAIAAWNYRIEPPHGAS